jgi:glycosyltransferase involved in cell wall biosynthesis
MDEDSALLVPSRLQPVDDPQGIYKGQTWAEPDLEAAAQALKRLRDDPALRARLADAGRRAVTERLSPDAWFRTLPAGLQAAALRLKGEG